MNTPERHVDRHTASWPLPPVAVGVIGAGQIGAYHAENLAVRVPGARLAAIADPLAGLADQVAARLGCSIVTRDYQDLLRAPDIDAVVIATPAQYHADVIVAAAQARKAIFCEKPIAHSLADAGRAIRAAHEAGVTLQIGFQRRFDQSFCHAHELVASGALGKVQLLRSLTRDPELDQPESVPPWGIFLETLIHDFDVLRFLAHGAEPTEIFAMADALVRPEWKSRGLLDTAVVTVRFDSGAFATADASFEAVYGYDVRAEVFGSKGMASVGESSPLRVIHHTRDGSTMPRPYWFVDVFGAAYLAELIDFVRCVRAGVTPSVTGEDGRAALVMALAAIRSVESGRAVRLDEITA